MNKSCCALAYLSVKACGDAATWVYVLLVGVFACICISGYQFMFS